MQNSSSKFRLLNIDINDLTMEEFLRRFTEGIVVTPNVDHMMKLQRDVDFYKSYQNADYVVLDSRVILYLLRLFGIRIKGVIPGSELLPAFCNYHKDNKQIRMFLLGGMDGVARTAAKNINHQAGRELVVDAYSPTMGFEKKFDEKEQIIERINKSEANVLVIGVGAPKQEKWLMQHWNLMPHIKMGMALGAALDFEAGNKKRAPRWMQKMGMEWL
ncbi:MAG: WecB/TagA/CpsF family glycosyltransferase, partial [Bacteroidales bacterium]